MRRTFNLLTLLTLLWACSNDPALRHDTADTGTSDTDLADTAQPTEDTTSEPDGWWTAEPDWCGPDEVRTLSERYAPPTPPAELGETPRVLWTTNRICQGAISERIRGESAYGPLTIDGVTEPRLAVVYYTQRGNVIEVGPELVGTLDAHTGEDLHCLDLLSEETTTAPFLLIAPDLGRYFLAFETASNRGASVFNSGPQPPSTFQPYAFGHLGTPISVGSTWAMSQQGQALTAAGNRIVVSYDAITGQRLWAKDPLTDWDIPFVHPDPHWVWAGVYHVAPDELLIYVTAQQRAEGPKESGLFRLDVCGQIEPVYTGIEAFNVVRLSNGDHVGHYVVEEGQRPGMALWKDWKVTYTVEQCHAFAVLSDERVACVNLRTSSQSSPQIQIHDFVNEPVTIQMDEEGTALKPWLTIGAGDVLVASGQWTEPSGELRIGLFFIRPPYTEVERFDLGWRPGQTGGDMDSPPIIAPDGILYTPFLDHIYAIQTDIFGLTRSVYPRSGRGGNANRGHVVLDP